MDLKLGDVFRDDRMAVGMSEIAGLVGEIATVMGLSLIGAGGLTTEVLGE
jgi:hypothetical protein